ncbi:DUF1129 family protein [Niallia sp. Krafla_26]|uniref:DUF1129 family protein n=1 Tax=Niallia sp. Krafla_26 TaxID=3064703 RepID=UPI003D184465
MEAKKLIEENNQKREHLAKENLRYYEDMLIYIRFASNKSEQETEEILTELLDHLLEAQDEGKTAEQVFGENPRPIIDEIIGELPSLITKKRTLTFAMIIVYFLAFSSFFTGLFEVIGYYAFNFGGLTRDIYIGSLFIEGLFSIFISFILLYAIISYFRWLCFRKVNKVVEFLSYWLYGVLSVGLFFVIFWFIPDFGTHLVIPVYWNLIIGILLYFVGKLIRKAI